MMLSYHTTFPWGAETKFKGKIWLGYVKSMSDEEFRKMDPEDFPPGSIYDGINAGKLHTIREDLKQRWRPGMKIEHVYHPYKKNGRDTFLRNTCTWVQPILIKYLPECIETQGFDATSGSYLPAVMIGGRPLSKENVSVLARNDGFDNINDFFKYFNSDFIGRIIHWTNVRY